MAQHDFAPAWLNFPSPPSSAKPSLSCDKPPEAPACLDNRSDVSRRRHNSSDGFQALNGPLNGRAGGSYSRKEKNGWRGRNGSEGGASRAAFHGTGGHCRSRPAAPPHGGKSKVPHENNSSGGGCKRDEGDRRKQFQAEDFPSLNPDAEREVNQNKAVTVGVWEHPPNPKSRTSKMMVIKRVPKEEQSSMLPAAPHSQPVAPKNGTPSFYKGLVPKPVAVPAKGSRSCSSSPVDKASQPRLMMRLTRARADRKSQFLKALKQDKVDEEDNLDNPCKDDEAFHVQNCNLGLGDENRNSFEHSTPRENGNAPLVARQQILRSSTFPQPEVLSSSLEAEHRLLKEMGWQEDSENDETCAPLTEDEMREFQAISEQLQKSSLRRNGFPKNGLPCDFLGAWRRSSGTFASPPQAEETETSSSDTSDDEA